MTVITNAKLNLEVESIVFPQYDTRGDFNAAVKNFADWTQAQVKARQDFNLRAYGPPKSGVEPGQETEYKIPPVYVCFLGHSMGGLVAADAALRLNNLPEKSPVIGILAFDTPYFGLNHTIFTQAAYDRVTGLAQKASGAYSLVSSYLPAAAAWNAVSTSSTTGEQETKSRQGGGGAGAPSSSSTMPGGFNPASLWSSVSSGTSSSTVQKEAGSLTKSTTTTTTSSSSSKWGWGSIALGVGAAVAATGAAVVVNSRMNKGMEYITSHIQFVGILWNNAQLRQRVSDILRLPIGFHCFYTQVQIPAGPSNNYQGTSRTFIELTTIPSSTRSVSFSARKCSGQDEIEAHMEMFNPAKNFDYYPMGEETVARIKGMVEAALTKDIP
ncbi:hypothetical protein BGZ83_011546 [Gryganskiella cystojenkinii]|nr:hypothetical protein BGZ83_011546 [Gryganskiella cystojenkinii]